MATTVRIEMLEAFNPREANIQLAKQAVTNILKIESLPVRDQGDHALLEEAYSNLYTAMGELRVVDVAPCIKSFLETSKCEALKSGVLETLEERRNTPETDLYEHIIDTLALANIYESVDERKSLELNAQAYFYLGTGQNNKINPIIDTLEHIQIYYSDMGDEREADGEFILSLTQMQDLDKILVAKINDFLAHPNPDEDLADRLAYLLESHEDQSVIDDLQQKLFAIRSEAGQAEYIESMLNRASEDGVEDDDVVTNPILARVGHTYGELFQKVGHFACEHARLKSAQAPQTALIPA